MGASRSRRSRRRAGRSWRGKLLLGGFGVLVAVGAYAGAVVVRAASTLPPVGNLGALRPATSVIYDLQGDPVSYVPAPDVRTPLSINQIPPVVQQAFIAVEDRHFYQEIGGISFRGIARAALADARGRPLQGGSTITQQLAKILYLTPQRTLKRKVQELLIGVELAQRYSRAQILDAYLNDAFLGDHAYGVQAAAEAYFSVPVDQLSLAQAALLAGLPQAPSGYDPLLHPQAARARRNLVLQAMAQQGYVTAAAAAAAEAAPLGLQPGKAAASTSPSSYPYPWFVDTVVEQLEGKYGLSPQQVETGGLRIYTTLVPQVYDAAQQAITTQLNSQYPETSGANPMQAAAVMMDQSNGDVLAIIGGRTHTAILGYDRALQAEQQTGSAIKPLVDYIPALQAGLTAGTVVNDVVHVYHPGPGQTYAPTDDNNVYYGLTTLTEALRRSVNTVAVQVLNRVGVARGVAEGRRLGLTDLTAAANDHLSVALGGTVGCCTPLEMTDAYATIANGGSRVTPRFILKVVAPSGQVLVQTTPRSQRVLDPRIAYVMTQMLETVDMPQPNLGWDFISGPHNSNFGTGYDATVQDNVPGWPMAAKTGTTNSSRQAWYLAYTPLYTAGVWVGRDQPQPQPGMYGGTTAGPIVKAMMTAALAGRQPVNFPQPAGVVQAPIDIMATPWHVAAPGPLTPAADIRQEWFVAGTQPTQSSGLWVQDQVPTNNDGALWRPWCLGMGAPEQKTFLNLPQPYGQAWAKGIAALEGTSNWQQFIPLEASMAAPTASCAPSLPGLGTLGRTFGVGTGG